MDYTQNQIQLKVGDEIIDFNDKKLKEYVNSKRPLIIKTVNANTQFIDIVEKFLSAILRKKNYHHLKSALSFILKELIGNAQKANLKRVYFNMNELDINSPEDYSRGIKEFSSIVKSDPVACEIHLPTYDMSIKVIFKEYLNKKFEIYVLNSSLLTEQEKERIHEKIDYFKENRNSLEIIDRTEGSGIGLFLSLKMMEKAGLKKTVFNFNTYKNMTVSHFSFDYENVKPPPYSDIAKEILNEIETLPKFPDNINELIKKLNNQDVVIQDLALEISKDPTLTAEMLKLVNSAKFTLSRKIGTIKDAINIIGINGLKNLLYSCGAIQSINTRFGSVPEIWEHCHKTGKIALKIAEALGLERESDEFFTSGLLHDIGKIVLMSFDIEKAKKIDELCKRKGIYLPIVEEIMMGLSHAIIGGKIATLWDFPKQLVDGITYHHDPIMANENKDIVNITYLANYFANVKTRDDIALPAIEPETREYLDIMSDKKLFDLVDKTRILDIINSR